MKAPIRLRSRVVNSLPRRRLVSKGVRVLLIISAMAWSGFGAAFGPVVLFALFSRRTSWQAALAGMVTGTVVLVVWKLTKLDAYMYEIVPGFICNSLTIFIVNIIVGQKDERVLRQYEEVAKIITTGE